MTTLEEVFLKVNEDVEKKEKEGEDGKELGSDEFFDQEGRDHRGSSINRNEKPEKLIEEEPVFSDGSLRATELESSSENLVGNGSLCQSIKALLSKRFNLYKRDKCGLVCELVVPVILVLIGLIVVQLNPLNNPVAFTLDTSAYPGPQRLLYNTNPVDLSTSFYSPEEVLLNLPDYDSYWQLTSTDNVDSYTEFYKEVTD